MRSCAMWTQGDRDEPFHTLLVCCPTYPMGEQLKSGFAAVDTPSAAGHTSLVPTAAGAAEITPDRVPKPRAAGSTPAGATNHFASNTDETASARGLDGHVRSDIDCRLHGCERQTHRLAARGSQDPSFFEGGAHRGGRSAEKAAARRGSPYASVEANAIDRNELPRASNPRQAGHLALDLCHRSTCGRDPRGVPQEDVTDSAGSLEQLQAPPQRVSIQRLRTPESIT